MPRQGGKCPNKQNSPNIPGSPSSPSSNTQTEPSQAAYRGRRAAGVVHAKHLGVVQPSGRQGAAQQVRRVVLQAQMHGWVGAQVSGWDGGCAWEASCRFWASARHDGTERPNQQAYKHEREGALQKYAQWPPNTQDSTAGSRQVPAAFGSEQPLQAHACLRRTEQQPCMGIGSQQLQSALHEGHRLPSPCMRQAGARGGYAG